MKRRSQPTDSFVQSTWRCIRVYVDAVVQAQVHLQRCPSSFESGCDVSFTYIGRHRGLQHLHDTLVARVSHLVRSGIQFAANEPQRDRGRSCVTPPRTPALCDGEFREDVTTWECVQSSHAQVVWLGGCNILQPLWCSL